MFSRYIDNFDFKSRFRILKGGKVSLVVSAMLVSASLLGTNANALPTQEIVTGTTPYTSTLSADTDFLIYNLFTTTAGDSPFVIDANGHNTNINITSNPIGVNSIVINHSDAPKDLVGVNIINLGTEESSITTTDNYISIRNSKGEAFGITSKNPGVAGNWDNMTINLISNVPEPIYGSKYGLTVSGVGYAEGIFVDGDFKNSSITNDVNSAFYISNADTTLTKAYGIDIGNNLVNSTIRNNGTFEISSNNQAYGIYVDRDVENSQVINNGDMNIIVERNLVNADVMTQDSTQLYASGIEVGAVRQHIVPTEGTINISNSGTIDASATGNLTVDGNIESGLGEETYTNLTAESKGITIGLLEGDSGVDEGAIASFKNSGEIMATSKLNLTFTSESDSINFGWSYFSATATGLEVDGNDAEIINTETGTINALAEINIDPQGIVSSDYLFAESNGIKSYGGLEETSLINNGSINATATFNGSNRSNALANGIYVNYNVDTSTISLVNEITVNAEAKNSNIQGMAYSEANGLHIWDSVENSTITNGGLLDVEAKVSDASDGYAEAYGLVFDNSIYDTQILNVKEGAFNGQIIVNAESTTDSYSNAYANGIYAMDGFYDSSIQNSGDITVTSKATQTGESGYANTESYGIYASDFRGFNTDASTIVNTGNIDVLAEADSYNYSNAEAYGIYVSSYGGGEISNSGNIKVNAKSTIVEGDYVWAESYGISAYFQPSEGQNFSINNSGTIEAYINNKLDRDGYSLDISQSVTVTNTGTLKGNIYVEGTLTNNGTADSKAIIELSHNAMGEENAYISNFINGEYGKLTIGLKTDGTLDGTTYSQLGTQNATFESGSTIDVNVLSASTNSGLLAGKRLENVITATNALTINEKLNITDNSALLNFNYVTNDGWINGEDGVIHLDIKQAQTVEEAVNKISTKAAPTQYANAQGAAKALDKIIDNINNNPQMESVITRLNQLPTNDSVAKAVEGTTPVATNATVGATTQISNGIAGIVSQRQNANISNGGMNSGDGMFSENNLWIKPFGSIGSQNDKDGINGFDLKTYGLGFGADTEYKNNQKVGLAFFYTNGNVDVNNMNQNADLDVFTTLVYGNVPVIDDKTNFLYQAGYSWQKTQTDRAVFTGDIAESKYTSKTASLDLKLMRDVNVNKDLLLQPLVNTTYRHFTNPAYNEIGADALNLNVDKFTSSDLIVGLGTLAHYKLTDDSKIVGNVNVGYDLHDKNQTITSAYEGASGVNFGTDGIDNGRWSYEAGIGYEMDINKTNNINVSYDYQGQGKDFSNNVVSAKYVLKF